MPTDTASAPFDFDRLWDFDDPAATETRFREALPTVRTEGPARVAELLTQIARTQGLQRRFADAHATLDNATQHLEAVGKEGARARVRLLLERGRVYNSSGDREAARPLFLQALEQAEAAGEEGLAVDAAHMMGIVVPAEEQVAWDERALAMAERSSHPAARNWLGALYNNLGWTYFDLKQYDRALEYHEKGRAWRKEKGAVRPFRIARWSVARLWRALGRVEEALAEQTALRAEWDRDGEDAPYVEEELGECLLALGREAEARPHLARAFAALSQDPWLREQEPERIARLQRLA